MCSCACFATLRYSPPIAIAYSSKFFCMHARLVLVALVPSRLDYCNDMHACHEHTKLINYTAGLGGNGRPNGHF